MLNIFHYQFQDYEITYTFVDSVGPAYMSGDLASKKPKLYLRRFGVGVLVVDRTVMP